MYQSIVQPEYTMKLCMAGESNVGKSSLFTRFHKNKFHDQRSPTIGLSFAKMAHEAHEMDELVMKQMMKRTLVDDYEPSPYLEGDNTIYLWDTAGQERYRSIVDQYFRGCHGVFLVMDVTQENGHKDVEYWYQHIKGLNHGYEPIFMVLLNKFEVPKEEHRIQWDKVFSFCKKKGLLMMTTSAKEGIHTQKALQCMVDQVYYSLSEIIVKPRKKQLIPKQNCCF